MADDKRTAAPIEEEDEFASLFEGDDRRTAAPIYAERVYVDHDQDAHEEDDMEDNRRERRPRRRRNGKLIFCCIALIISLCCNAFFVVRLYRDSNANNQPAINQTDDQQKNQGNSNQQTTSQDNEDQPTDKANGNQLTDEEYELIREYLAKIVAGEAGSGIQEEPIAPSAPPVSDQAPETENDSETPQAPVVSEPPQVIVIENDYRDRERKASSKVTSDATTSLLETKLELNTHGKITVNLYGNVSKVYAVVGTGDYTEVQLTNAAEYRYFTYQVPEKEQVLFKLEMTDGTLYYLSVFDS